MILSCTVRDGLRTSSLKQKESAQAAIMASKNATTTSKFDRSSNLACGSVIPLTWRSSVTSLQYLHLRFYSSNIAWSSPAAHTSAEESRVPRLRRQRGAGRALRLGAGRRLLDGRRVGHGARWRRLVGHEHVGGGEPFHVLDTVARAREGVRNTSGFTGMSPPGAPGGGGEARGVPHLGPALLE